jgi:Tfp pilus assembly protein PilN
VIEKLNLSSSPFRNRALPWLLSAVLSILSAAGLMYSYSLMQSANGADIAVKKDIEEIEAKVKELKGKGELVQQELSAEQRQTLVAAHKLVARKNFAWSRLFADVESLLPPSVSVAKINVQDVFEDTNGTKAILDFSVLSRDYQSVVNMIDNMNSSGIFKAELRGQDLQKGETITYSEYTISMIYTPRASIPLSSGQDIAASGEVQK